MKIQVQTFGAFRQFGNNIELEIEINSKVKDIRKVLIDAIKHHDAKFDIEGLVLSSKFANDTQLLEETDVLKVGSVVTILPPVSGG